MGVTRVGTVRVCVVLCSGDEERRVRGTGGVCRCGGDRGVEPVGINILVQLPRGSFNVVQLGVGQTFAKVFSKFAVRSRKAESRTKVAVSSWWVGTFIRPRSGRRDF